MVFKVGVVIIRCLYSLPNKGWSLTVELNAGFSVNWFPTCHVFINTRSVSIMVQAAIKFYPFPEGNSFHEYRSIIQIGQQWCSEHPKGAPTSVLCPLSRHIPMGKGVIDEASLTSFQTNINALQEPNASGKSIVVPHPDYPGKWKQSWGRQYISLLRKQVITSDKSLPSLVLNFEEWSFYTHNKHYWLLAINITTSSQRTAVFRSSWVSVLHLQ